MIVAIVAVAIASADEPVVRDLPGEVMPDRHWDELSLHLAIAIDPGGAIAGTATPHVAPLGAPSGWFRLHSVGLSIDAVRVDGIAVTGWRIGEDFVDIPLPTGTGEREIAVDYHGRPELGLQFRGGQGTADRITEVWSQGEDTDNRFWFPGWDYPNDRFTYSADITAPTGLVALTNGELIDAAPVADHPDRTVSRFALTGTIPNYLVAIAIGDYKIVHDQQGETPLDYVVPKWVSDADAQRTFGLVKAPMAWYGEMFGLPYPWSRDRQVLAQRFMYVAMENPEVTTFDTEVLSTDDALRTTWTEEVIAHELAHHWFGDWLTCYGFREMWLNEGFAEYWDGRWIQHAHGDDAYAGIVRGWREEALKDTYPLAPRADSKADGREYGAVYERGAMVLQLLSHTIGDEAFVAGIREYIADHAEGLVSSEDLRRALEDTGGQHLGWLFDEYVYGAGVPKLTVTHTWADGALTVDVHQEGDGAFTVPIDVEIGDQAPVRHRIWAGPGDTRLVVPAAAPPRWVAVDPDCAVLADWTQTQSTEEWVAQLAGTPTACARWEAVDHLGVDSGEAGRDALVAVADDTTRWPGLRAEAAKVLGQHGDAGTGALAKLTSDGEPWVRRAAADALGHAGASELLKAPLADRDPWVRAAALSALGEADPDKATVTARAVWKGKDDTIRQWERIAAAEVLGARGSPVDLVALEKRLAPSEPRTSRDAAGDAAVRLFQRISSADQDRGRPALTAAIAPMLDDADVLARLEAASWLGQVGDERSAVLLEVKAAGTTVPTLREAMLDAASAIRTRASQPEPPEDDAERLDERIKALEGRVERLEHWR